MDLPRWDSVKEEGGASPDHYTQGLICSKCKVHFGLIGMISVGSPHQWVDSAMCGTCSKVAVAKHDHPDKLQILVWLDEKVGGA